jgi:predicted alpha/beta hydrolase family esterase
LLPFPTQIVTSDNDAAVSTRRAMEMARNWGAEIGVLSEAGHINVKSGHQRWEQGFAYLYRLQGRMAHHARRRA